MALDAQQHEDFGKIINSNYQFRLGDYFSEGFELFKNGALYFIFYTIIVSLLTYLITLIPNEMVNTMVSSFIMPVFHVGFYIAADNLKKNQRIELADFFRGFEHFLPIFLASLVTFVFLLIGFIVLVIPGVYLLVAYFLTNLLILFGKLEFWDAMEASRKIVTKKWGWFLLFGIALILFNIVGFFCLIIGLLVTVPVSACAIYSAYDDIVTRQLGSEEMDISDHLITED